MALTSAQLRDAWNHMRLQSDASIGSSFTKGDLDAAAAAVDTWITNNQASFVAALPEPFKTASSAAQKTLLFCYIALKRAGVI